MEKDDLLKKLEETYTKIKIVFAIITGLYTVGILILKAYNFLVVNAYFDFYGISINLYQNNAIELFNITLNQIIILSLFYVSTLTLYYVHKCTINYELIKLKNLIFIAVLNLFLANIISKEDIFLGFIIISVSQIIVLLIFSGISKPKEQNLLQDIIDFICVAAISLLVIIYSTLKIETNNVLTNKNYRIISNNKAIVYTSNDYYITLDCEIKDNNLILYKGTQEKINNNNIYSIFKTFEIVSLLDILQKEE